MVGGLNKSELQIIALCYKYPGILYILHGSKVYLLTEQSYHLFCHLLLWLSVAYQAIVQKRHTTTSSWIISLRILTIFYPEKAERREHGDYVLYEELAAGTLLSQATHLPPQRRWDGVACCVRHAGRLPWVLI